MLNGTPGARNANVAPSPSSSTPSSSSSSSPNETRVDFLNHIASNAARTWAEARCAELVREGRRVEGGWPGTMPEARTRIATLAAKALSARSMSALTFTELDRVARITYDEARRSWMTYSGPAQDDEEEEDEPVVVAVAKPVATTSQRSPAVTPSLPSRRSE